jgi:hypothetical protein
MQRSSRDGERVAAGGSAGTSPSRACDHVRIDERAERADRIEAGELLLVIVPPALASVPALRGKKPPPLHETC